MKYIPGQDIADTLNHDTNEQSSVFSRHRFKPNAKLSKISPMTTKDLEISDFLDEFRRKWNQLGNLDDKDWRRLTSSVLDILNCCERTALNSTTILQPRTDLESPIPNEVGHKQQLPPTDEGVREGGEVRPIFGAQGIDSASESSTNSSIDPKLDTDPRPKKPENEHDHDHEPATAQNEENKPHLDYFTNVKAEGNIGEDMVVTGAQQWQTQPSVKESTEILGNEASGIDGSDKDCMAGCGSPAVFWCTICDTTLCGSCWPKQAAHHNKAGGSEEHQKSEIRLLGVFNSLCDFTEEDQCHSADRFAWFSIDPICHDIPLNEQRFDELSIDFNIEHPRHPILVSFIGDVGAGKSTVIKTLIKVGKLDPIHLVIHH